MGTPTVVAEADFNAIQFEKTLTNLKDSQDTINSCCQWCLKNRQHHKKIVNCWLNVLKRVKVEHRLILFYLANDVVQYSKRRNYEYVESWGTAIQKATTLVRDEKVKHKILRIFKIWEQRGVYGEEFITDLSGLISVQPTGPKNDEPHEFQASYVINKIKNCSNLERDTDLKLKELKEHNPKIQISDGLLNSLKDRVHVDDVEAELDVYVQHMDNYINALNLEIKNRIALISVLKQAETQLEADRKDVKMVAHAYKTFGQRLKTVQKKLEEHSATLPSPIPSPDINAPSPSPDSELELPDETPVSKSSIADTSIDLSATIQFTNPGYYNPVSAPSLNTSSIDDSATLNTSANDSNLSFLSNGFTSFLGQNMSFDITNISTTGLFSSSLLENTTISNSQTTNSYISTPTHSSQPPMPVEAPPVQSNNDISNVYNPLLPPPMPPFSKTSDDGNFSFAEEASNFPPPYQPPPSYSSVPYNADSDPNTAYDYQIQTGSNPYPPDDNYEPSNNSNRWLLENPPWDEVKDLDTPESPPMFEKKGYGTPVEYHDGSVRTGATDVDHRILPGLGDLEAIDDLGGKDVDHRNLISLTGSPNLESAVVNGSSSRSERVNLKTITTDASWDHADQDYRKLPTIIEGNKTSPPLQSNTTQDQDYRHRFNLDNLNVPPPPPPPKSPENMTQASSKSKGDNVENVDMDLSDDMETGIGEGDNMHLCMEPPPPLPDLLDDVDANQFLDEISNDLNEFSNLSADLNFSDGDGNLNVMIDPMSDSAASTNESQNRSWHQSMPPLGRQSMGPPVNYNMPPPPTMPPPNMLQGMNRMEMNNLPPNLMPNGPPMQSPPPWGDNQPPSWNMQGNNMPYYDEPQYPEDNIGMGDSNMAYRKMRGNFRGNFPGKGDGFSFRGRSRGGRGMMRGRGNGRGGRGSGPGFFRPRGNFRGGFNRGGF